MLLQLVQTGRYDLPGGTQIRDSTMTSVRTWNELIRKEQSMKYGEGWNNIDHVISPNSVQKQPYQPKEWKSLLHISPPSSSSPSWRRSSFDTETSAPATVRLPLLQEEYRLPGRALRDPECDEYHSTTDKTNGKDKKTMSEKSKSKSSDAIFKPSAPNQFPVDGKGGRDKD